MQQATRQLILDIETTGLRPDDGHRIIEFAALEMIDRKLTGKSLHLYINPERPIDPAAIRIHGITDEQVANKPQFGKVVSQILDFIKDGELIIHNAKFDMGFLSYQLNLEQVNNPEIKPIETYISGVVDTLHLARQKFPGGKNNLDALCDWFMINRSSRDYHGALIDCCLLADVYLALTREQINLLDNDVKANNREKLKFTKIDTNHMKLKIIKSTPEEDKVHIKYLRELDRLSHGHSHWFNAIKKFEHE